MLAWLSLERLPPPEVSLHDDQQWLVEHACGDMMTVYQMCVCRFKNLVWTFEDSDTEVELSEDAQYLYNF